MARIVKVSDIKANLLRPATTSHFEVEIPLPPSTSFQKWRGVGKQDKIQLMCSEASLPGSNLATFDVSNDRTGVTEKHVHRRIFDDRIDLTFYVDAGLYQPIKFFEEWISYIVNGNDDQGGQLERELVSDDYFYRMRYPEGNDGYTSQDGLEVRKFERDLKYTGLTYNFIKSYPVSITSMPVSYDGSDILKCTVAMTYIRYVINHGTWEWPPTITTAKLGEAVQSNNPFNPFTQSQFNVGGFTGMAANLVNSVVDNATGSDFAGDVAGGIAGRLLRGL